jgi:hypothetical protein
MLLKRGGRECRSVARIIRLPVRKACTACDPMQTRGVQDYEMARSDEFKITKRPEVVSFIRAPAHPDNLISALAVVPSSTPTDPR